MHSPQVLEPGSSGEGRTGKPEADNVVTVVRGVPVAVGRAEICCSTSRGEGCNGLVLESKAQSYFASRAGLPSNPGVPEPTKNLRPAFGGTS